MNTNGLDLLEMNDKRLKTILLLILSKLNKNNYSGYRRNWV